MDNDYATLVSTEIDPFLEPWVQECLTSMPNILSRHKIEVGPTHDTLVKMPSTEAFDLVYINVNKSEDQRHVEVLIARGLLAENVIIMVDSTLYSGIPFTLSEPRCLVLTESKKRSNTTKDSYLSTVSFGYFIVSCASQSCPWIQSTSPKNGRCERHSSHMEKWASSRTLMRSTTTRLKRSMRQST